MCSSDLPDGVDIVGRVGRLWPQKNVQMFLHAAKRVAERRPDARFVLIGDGPDWLDLEMLAGRLGIDAKVRFLGYRADGRELMAGFEVYCQTSQWEGCSLSTLEAMARALPIVATNVRGTRELVADGETGFLVAENDDEALADRIAALLDAGALAMRLGGNAPGRQRNDFRYDDYIRAYRNLYDELLAESDG